MSNSPYHSISFITCLYQIERYKACQASIESLDSAGFHIQRIALPEEDRSSAAERYNRAWDASESDLIVFCHEDVEFPSNWLEQLKKNLNQLQEDKVHWGLLGPMGRQRKNFFGSYADPDQTVFHGPLPAEVDSLDEMCLIVRRDLPLRFDPKLGGYHLYGVDLAIQCRMEDYKVLAIDQFLQHHTETRGNVSRPPEYHQIKKRLQKKWRWKTSKIGKQIGTTSGQIHLGWYKGWF